MTDIPEFDVAVARFQQLLLDSGQPTTPLWVFRDDVYARTPSVIALRYPPPRENSSLAVKVFNEGRASGFVAITAIGTTGKVVAATVWFPRTPRDEVQGWNCGMKLSMVQPLPNAKLVSGWLWGITQYLPSYRRYQREAAFIGPRAWAAV
jgi:hypothetical protein